jgi:SAM-dependent methyltransferase
VAGPGETFKAKVRQLEAVYLESNDPIVQSGFSGGHDRWVAERSPLLDGINGDGDFLDVGCANGLLAQDVMKWAADRGFEVIPHGIDIGPQLVQLARHRLPAFANNFWVADAWAWEPGRKWTFVYSLLDLSSEEMWHEWLSVLSRLVEPAGRLIVGSYGSRSRCEPPVDVAAVMGACGWMVDGSSRGGDPVTSRFAWSSIS